MGRPKIAQLEDMPVHLQLCTVAGKIVQGIKFKT